MTLWDLLELKIPGVERAEILVEMEDHTLRRASFRPVYFTEEGRQLVECLNPPLLEEYRQKEHILLGLVID